jgi:hypothetical protein
MEPIFLIVKIGTGPYSAAKTAAHPFLNLYAGITYDTPKEASRPQRVNIRPD